ncbi:co-chaperone YbbN [Phenylobacterium sp.]|jgi:putative thioredoxin|uniref:thioredoxin family protein n=1 Tax=Phenylobacterium sp. TaxID=1871053 RepID=UPI0025FF4F8A|nr:co-chaperone YbbN [Phenylobacterium sp.]MCA3722026.1 co-chaperone YbbN [Phenylobacterium sp.]
MALIGENPTPAGGAAPAGLIKDGTDAGFMADVIEASRQTPVIVDFWAPWCGPCKQLGPAIERAVTAARGKVKLVKIDIDQNPQFAGQLRVQSIPAVFAFVGGRPVDGFTGALPESQIKAFVERLAAQAPADETDELLAVGREALEAGDLNTAAQAFARVLQVDPKDVRALGGMAKVYLEGGDPERAAEIAAMAPEGARDPGLESVRAALALASAAPAETAAFEARLAADPDDHEARFELARALAGAGRLETAMDHLLQIIAADREWNEGAARAQLLTVFEAAGPASDLARQGRRRLSAILFA